MQREENCRISNTIIQYIRKHKPQALPQFLEGFEEAKLTNEHYWISADEMNALYLRAEKIFDDANIMFDIGHQARALKSMGIIDLLLRLDSDPVQAFKMSAKYAALFSTTARIRIRELSGRHAVIERRIKKKPSRGGCGYMRGMYMSLLEQLKAKKIKVYESQCSVPVWEQGTLGHHCYHLLDGNLWQEDLSTGKKEDLGPVDANKPFAHDGVLYGASACIYHLQWSPSGGWWWRMLAFLTGQDQLLERLKKELFYEYELVERQNQQLRRNNRLLEELLQERTMLSKKLEKTVATRTMELEDTITQLKDLDEMKSYFLSITSHELRTPLTIIKGALNLLLTDGAKLSPERRQKYLLMAKNNADHLNLLISNLLDLSRLESGQLKLEVEQVDMIRLVRENVEEFRELARKNNLQLHAEFAFASLYLLGDELRLRQIIGNLLSNAIKFTPAGGAIKVSLRLDGSNLEIRVADTGIGIEEWEKEKIFRKFQQAERSLTRESAGVGLGLNIVKNLVELHDGSIRVESVKEKGSTFIVILPCQGPQDISQMVKKRKGEGREPPLLLGGNTP
ncbi:hypothetical protein JW933_08070 [candidate division FCPU426 bacterium]|nr:hypothetical protein [candidate division FCPU426 bacterium]